MAEPQTTVTSVTVGTTPTALVAADGRVQWRTVELRPGSAKIAWYGDDDVTPDTGFPIVGDEPIKVDVGRNGLWGVTTSGTAVVTVRSRFLDLG